MSDVTAIVLTTGEATLERALASVRAQTHELAETVVIEGVTPFHRAFNEGAAAVRTPYFVQVDADMVLDPTCVADLRAAMWREMGIAAGLLRDPLVGRVPAVKLFRTAALAGREVSNSITPDVVHYELLGRAGWLTLYVLDPDGSHTFGEHRPAYTAHYTWGTYFLLGSRYRFRRDAIAFRWRQSRLRESDHPMAALARISLCEGLYCLEESDVPKTYPGEEGAERLEALLAAEGELELDEPRLQALLARGGRPAFDAFHELGLELARARAGASLARALALLGSWGEASSSAEVGLARGVLAPSPGRDPGPDFEHLCGTLSLF